MSTLKEALDAQRGIAVFQDDMQKLRDLADHFEQAVLVRGGRMHPLEVVRTYEEAEEVVSIIRRMWTTLMTANPVPEV